MSQIQVVAQYPEYGFAVLEDDGGQFLFVEDVQSIIPLRDKKKVEAKTLIAQFVKNRPEMRQQAA